MQVTDHRAWTDLEPHTHYRPPNVVVLAAELAIDQVVEESDLYHPGVKRRVLYDDGTKKWYMELTPYIHPVGAGALVISAVEGLLLTEAGAISTSGDTNSEIAGAPFSHYYETTADMGATHSFRVTTLNEGDLIWLVRRGDVELLVDVGVTAGDTVVCENGAVAGAIAPADAMAGPTAAQILENLFTPNGLAIAQAKETALASALAQCWLYLCDRFSR